MTRLLRRPEVERLTGLACSTIYEKIAAGDFPRQIKLGLRAVGWSECDINEWIEARVSNADSTKKPHTQ